jgi:hypothetical protein
MQRWLIDFLNLKSTPCRKGKSKESGVFMILFCILLFLLVGLISLAVDLSLVANARLNLRYIVDNTLMNAPLMILTYDYDESEVRDRLLNLSRANLELDGYTDSKIINLDYDVGDTEIQASAKINKGLFLAINYVYQADSLNLTINSLLKIPRINLLILSDYSFSMTDVDNLKPTQNKFTTALGGMVAVAKWLRPKIDRVSLVKYSDFAKLPVPFNLSGGYVQEDVINDLVNTRYHSWSNINDGLRVALGEFARLPENEEEVNILAIYSDLRSNVGLFNFHPSSVKSLSPAGVGYEYYFFPAKMKAYNKGAPSPPPPAPKHTNILSHPSLRSFPLSGTAPWLGQIPTCETGTWESYLHPAGVVVTVPLNPPFPDVSACISSTGIIGPYMGVINPGLPANDAKYFIQQSLNLAIDQADAARARKVSVFTISIGKREIGPPDVYNGPLGSMNIDIFSLNYLNRFNLNSKSLEGVDFPGLSPAAPLFTSTFKDYSGDWFQANGSTSFGVDEASRLVFGRVNFDMQY